MNNELLINLVLVAIAITFLLQFIISKKSFLTELRNYKTRLKEEAEKRKQIELEYQGQIENIKTSQSQQNPDIQSTIDSLLEDLEDLRKEKDEELKMRLEAEKQIDLALQKTKDVQRRIDDWKIIQEANLQDATDAIVKVGNDLYDRLIVNHRNESEMIRNKVDDTVKNIYEYLEKIVKQVQFLNIHNIDSQKAVSAAIGMNAEAINVNYQSRNLEDILKSAHLHPAIDYFMHHNLPEEVKKSVLCETMITLDKNSAIVVDIKSARFFLELFSGRARNDNDAESNFKNRIDRYLTYLSNPKYRANILQYFSKQQIISSSAQITMVMLVASEKEIEEFKKLGDRYNKILVNNNINLHSLKSFSNLIFGE